MPGRVSLVVLLWALSCSISFLAIPCSARAVDSTPISTSLAKRQGRVFNTNVHAYPAVFWCSGDLPGGMDFRGLSKWDGRRWSPRDFSSITQLCNFQNVGCFCGEPGDARLRPELDCSWPVPMRTELNIGMTEGPPNPLIPGDPLQPANPGFRAICEAQCFCSRAGPELRERLREYLAATPERHSVLRGSVRPMFREAPVRPGTWWHDDDSDNEIDGDYPLVEMLRTDPLPTDDQPPAGFPTGLPSDPRQPSPRPSCPRASCWRAGSCSRDRTSGCSCLIPSRPTLRLPPFSPRPPLGPLPPTRLAGVPMTAICGSLRMAFKRDLLPSSNDPLAVSWNVSQPSTSPPPIAAIPNQPIPLLPSPSNTTITGPVPPQSELILDNMPLCPCNCTFIHELCCTAPVIAQRGIITTSLVTSAGFILPPPGMCCNKDTGDLQPALPGNPPLANETLCH